MSIFNFLQQLRSWHCPRNADRVGKSDFNLVLVIWYRYTTCSGKSWIPLNYCVLNRVQYICFFLLYQLSFRHQIHYSINRSHLSSLRGTNNFQSRKGPRQQRKVRNLGVSSIKKEKQYEGKKEFFEQNPAILSLVMHLREYEWFYRYYQVGIYQKNCVCFIHI